MSVPVTAVHRCLTDSTSRDPSITTPSATETTKIAAGMIKYTVWTEPGSALASSSPGRARPAVEQGEITPGGVHDDLLRQPESSRCQMAEPPSSRRVSAPRRQPRSRLIGTDGSPAARADLGRCETADPFRTAQLKAALAADGELRREQVEKVMAGLVRLRSRL